MTLHKCMPNKNEKLQANNFSKGLDLNLHAYIKYVYIYRYKNRFYRYSIYYFIKLKFQLEFRNSSRINILPSRYKLIRLIK